MTKNICKPNDQGSNISAGDILCCIQTFLGHDLASGAVSTPPGAKVQGSLKRFSILEGSSGVESLPRHVDKEVERKGARGERAGGRGGTHAHISCSQNRQMG